MRKVHNVNCFNIHHHQCKIYLHTIRDREIENLRRQIDLLKSGIEREEEKAYELEIKAK